MGLWFLIFFTPRRPLVLPHFQAPQNATISYLYTFARHLFKEKTPHGEREYYLYEYCFVITLISLQLWGYMEELCGVAWSVNV